MHERDRELGGMRVIKMQIFSSRHFANVQLSSIGAWLEKLRIFSL
jgi:hypothetical protein